MKVLIEKTDGGGTVQVSAQSGPFDAVGVLIEALAELCAERWEDIDPEGLSHCAVYTGNRLCREIMERGMKRGR